MRYWKRAGALLAAGALLLGLTACGSSITDDATVYVQGLLDANYKGEISQDYIDVVEDMTQEQAQADHENNLEIEAGYLLSILAVELPTPAPATRPSPPCRTRSIRFWTNSTPMPCWTSWRP